MTRIKILLSALGIVSMAMPYAAFAQTNVKPDSTAAGATSIYPPPTRICPYDKLLQQGSSGDDVKALQSLLAEDKTIYPEGLKTGYYGGLTAEAVKRLQVKQGLSSTGILDDDTRELIFPCVVLRVVSPNGGETWNIGETYEIMWETEAPYYILNREMDATEGKLREFTLAPGAALPASAIRPFYPHLSIDLVRTDVGLDVVGGSAGVVYHIGGASLYGDRSFKWPIPKSIPESQYYKVRISVWKSVPEPWDCKLRSCPLAPQAYPVLWRGYLWDESDSEFAITGGGIIPTPDYAKLKLLHQHISAAVESLQKALKILEQLLIQPL